MVKRIVLLVCAVSMVCSVGAVFAEEESSLEFGLSLDYVSKYIWRGQNLQDDGAFQPGFEVYYGGLTAGIWGSMELSNLNDNSGEFTEVDYYVDYSGDLLEGVGFSVGAIYYQFPNTEFDSTTELYAGLSFDLPLSPSITYYKDIDEAEGTYVSVAIGHSIESISEDLPIGMEIGASLGWGDSDYNEFYWGFDDGAVNDLAISVAFPIALGDWTLSPSINYVTLMDTDVRRNSFVDDADFLYAGVSLSTSF